MNWRLGVADVSLFPYLVVTVSVADWRYTCISVRRQSYVVITSVVVIVVFGCCEFLESELELEWGVSQMQLTVSR